MDLPSIEPQQVRPQRVYWAPNAALPAGIRVCDEGGDCYSFVPWLELKAQLEKLLLPQLFAAAEGYTVGLLDYFEKKDWLCRIFDPGGEVYCALWFGGDPDCGWRVDGLVRAGMGDDKPVTRSTNDFRTAATGA